MGEAFDPEILEYIRRHLARADSFETRRVEVLRRPIDGGSLAAADGTLPGGKFVGLYAGQHLVAALDHLAAWRVIAHGPEVWPRSPMTLLRGALENAARCRWYVDRAVRPGFRVGRGVAGRIHDQEERKKFDRLPFPERRDPLPVPPGGRTATQRLAELRGGAGRRESAGVVNLGYTDTTAILRDQGMEWWYRLCSGMAHGIEWVLPATVLERNPELDGRPGTAGGSVTISPAVVGVLTAETVGLTEHAIVDLEHYYSPAT